MYCTALHGTPDFCLNTPFRDENHNISDPLESRDN